jgi:hypothetical protein
VEGDAGVGYLERHLNDVLPRRVKRRLFVNEFRPEFPVDIERMFGYDEGSLEVPGVTALLPFEKCVLVRAELVEEAWWLSRFCP